MTPERWARIKEVFQSALERNEPERSTYLDETCGMDEELRRHVELLLQEHRETTRIQSPVKGQDLSGKKVSHYNVIEKLGEGGMGVVYKAEDTRLHRFVALKFIRPDAVENPELKARFLNEAEAAAALIHPNICVVHEIDAADEQSFIAMEFVEGESLAEKIKKRPLPIEEGLDIAGQVADGLQAAHERGIFHRDIKPANIMIDAKGRVKIMDFGLAHLEEATRITKTGTSLGTPAYMSPEQVRGESVDRRTDIWSLGVVLYEMITGQLPFRGESAQTVAVAIRNDEPKPITAQRAGVPLELEWIVAKALAKSPEERFQHVEEMVVDMRSLRRKVKTGATAMVTKPQETAGPVAGIGDQLAARRRRYLATGAAGLLAVAIALILAMWLWWPESAGFAPVRKFAVAPGADVRDAVISPNGRHIAYVAQGKLCVQDLDQVGPRILDGAEGARSPFWSPESDSVCFGVGRDLRKVSVNGGVTLSVCQMPTEHLWGGSWSHDGEVIVFSTFSGGGHRLYRVPAQGGVPELVIDPEESERALHFAWPHFLPPKKGQKILVFSKDLGGDSLVVLYNMDTKAETALAKGTHPVYSPSGHIVFQTSLGAGGLWALPFSRETLEPFAEAFAVSPNGVEPSAAGDGTLVYTDDQGTLHMQLSWLDRSGRRLASVGQPQGDIHYLDLSPDGTQIAVRGTENGNRDIWLHHTSRPMKTRLTVNKALDTLPVWSPSGEQLAFSSTRNGPLDIFVCPADGSGEATLLFGTSAAEYVTDWSPDGEFILYDQLHAGTAQDLWYLELHNRSSEHQAVAFLATPFRETGAKLSPDARFVAYASDESGRYEVYVRPFPEGSGKWQVSSDGGERPRWGQDGKELFYVENETLVVVGVTTAPTFVVGSAKRLFRSPELNHADFAHYDVSPDGKRFVVAEPAGDGRPVIRVVQNWYEEFRERR